MEESNWNVDQMLHWLDIKIDREDRDIAKQKKQMDESFLDYFEWNMEGLYKSHFMSKCYKKLRQTVEGTKDIDEIRNILKNGTDYCKKQLLEGQLDYHYSSRAINIAHFLELECLQQLIKDYREFTNILVQTPPEKKLQHPVSKVEKNKELPEKKVKSGIRH